MQRRKRLKPANGLVRLDRIAETLLDPVVARAGFSSTQVISAWPDIVGPELAARSRPEKLRWPQRYGDAGPGSGPGGRGSADGATLVVRAEGIDALEIQHMASNIAARINAIFGWNAVSRIAIRQGPVARRTEPAPEPAAGAASGGDPSAGRPSGYAGDREGSDREGGDRDERLETVADDGLRSALARLGARITASTDTNV